MWKYGNGASEEASAGGDRISCNTYPEDDCVIMKRESSALLRFRRRYQLKYINFYLMKGEF